MRQMSLKAARITAGLSLSDVGSRLGVTRQTISSWERGESDVSAKNFLELCSLYGRSPDDIFLPTRST